MKVTSDMVIITFFYAVLTSVIVIQFNKVFNSHTAFEEYETSNDTKIPSFTLCPHPFDQDSSKNIDTFEEAMIAIENAKNDYSIQMTWAKPFTKG